MKTNFFALAFFVLTCIAAHASQAGTMDVKSAIARITNEESKCLDREMSEVGMKMCAGTAYESADRLLNQVYQEIVVNLKGSNSTSDGREILKRLVKAERAWISFREAQCSFEGTNSLGGSNEGLDILSCDVDMTIARVQQLSHN